MDVAQFSLLWLLAAVQFGPNALNCIWLAAFLSLRTALFAVAGIATVSLVYMEIIFVGKELFFTNSSFSLKIVQWCGIAWILYLGIKKIVSGKWINFNAEISRKSAYMELSEAYRNSIIISVSNPKVIVFYFAIFSQFLHPSTSATQAHVYFLVALLITCSVYVAYSLLGRWAGVVLCKKINNIPVDYISGTSYITIACVFFIKLFVL